MSPIINTVTTTFKQCRPNEINNISILYITNAQSNRKYFCCKYKETKLHNDKWREPPAIEFIVSLRVTAKA